MSNANIENLVMARVADFISLIKAMSAPRLFLYTITGALRLWDDGYHKGWCAAKELYEKR